MKIEPRFLAHCGLYCGVCGVPFRREHGTENWVNDEQSRYACPECGHTIFRGAKRCNKCKITVDLD